MKLLILFSIFLLSSVCGRYHYVIFPIKMAILNMNSLKEKLNHTVNSECIRNEKEKVLLANDMAYQKIADCLNTFDGIIPNELIPSKICNHKRPDWKKCIIKSINNIAPCFDEDLNWFFNHFVLNGIGYVFDYLCNDVFTPLKELMDLDGLDCISKITKDDHTEMQNRRSCVNHDALTSYDLSKVLMKKNETCTSLLYVDCIFEKVLKRICPNNDVLIHIFKGIMKAVEPACEQ